MPPLPEEFPIGWDEANGVELERAEPGGKAESIPEDSMPEEKTLKSQMADPPPPDSELKLDETKEVKDLPTTSDTSVVSASPTPEVVPDPVVEEIVPIDPALTQVEVPEKVFQPIVPPLSGDTTEDVHMITIILRPRADKARNKLLLRRIFGIMISQPGNDRFAFHIFEKGTGHLLEFPNLTTRLCPELINQINILVGSDNVRVEPITFQ
jgi:hypothetical protein